MREGSERECMREGKECVSERGEREREGKKCV